MAWEPALEQTTRPATRPEKMMKDCRMFRKLSEVISLRAGASSGQQRAQAHGSCITQTVNLLKTAAAACTQQLHHADSKLAQQCSRR